MFALIRSTCVVDKGQNLWLTCEFLETQLKPECTFPVALVMISVR